MTIFLTPLANAPLTAAEVTLMAEAAANFYYKAGCLFYADMHSVTPQLLQKRIEARDPDNARARIWVRMLERRSDSYLHSAHAAFQRSRAIQAEMLAAWECDGDDPVHRAWGLALNALREAEHQPTIAFELEV